MNKKATNPYILSLARESRGILQQKLAKDLNITQGTLSKIESSVLDVSEELTKKIAKILAYPESLFYLKGSELPTIASFRRKNEKVSRKIMKQVNAKVNLYRVLIETYLQNVTVKLTIPKISYQSPEQAAIEIRKHWSLNKGLISNLVEVLESHGVILFGFDFNAPNLDSRSFLTENGQPIIVYNKTLLGDRLRFALAFELGNIVMHGFNFVDLKHKANLFASEFLMPELDIKEDLKHPISIELLSSLKKKWKVSMQSILFRANTLRIISDNQKSYIWSQFLSLGIDKREPIILDVEIEKPLFLLEFCKKTNTTKEFDSSLLKLLRQEL